MEKVSIITVSFNSEKTICQTIESVRRQSYKNIEHIIIDGGSSDRTVELIKSQGQEITKFISEKDEGMYNAINKGILLSDGDIIGILNSDDYFCDDYVIEKVINVFEKENPDAVYGDVKFVKNSGSYKTVRYYSSDNFSPKKFRFGFMPAHPAFYVRKSIHDLFGLYNPAYKIAGDFEMMIRLIMVNNIKTRYIQIPIVSMRFGGLSNRSFRNILLLNSEDLRACRENGIRTNLFNIYLKYLIKAFEFIKIPKQIVQK